MAIDKLIPQYLNSDTDQKLVKSVEMTDNLNIRVSSDDEGTDGVVKNIKGITVVAAATEAVVVLQCISAVLPVAAWLLCM